MNPIHVIPPKPRIALDLRRWVGNALNDGLNTEQALAELRGRPVPWGGDVAPADKPRASRGKSAHG